MNYISHNINYLVKRENLSQNDFGAMFGIKSGLISKYVRQRTYPQIDTIQKICSHFNINIDDFINRSLADMERMGISPIEVGETELQYNTSGAGPILLKAMDAYFDKRMTEHNEKLYKLIDKITDSKTVEKIKNEIGK